MRRHVSSLHPWILILLLASCGTNRNLVPQEPPVDRNQKIDRAWALFVAGDYAEARAIFEEIIDHFPDDAAGHVGRGWCAVETDSLDLAYTSFQTSLQLADDPDGIAGLAVAASALGIDSVAVAAASRVGEDYQFSKIPSLDYRDLVFIRALGEFHLRRYVDCYASLRILNPSLQIDLDEYDFREQLFAALESIRDQT